MPFVPFPNVCQVEVVTFFAGQYVENVFHVLQSTDWDAAGLNSLAATFLNWWDTEVKDDISQDVFGYKVKARGLASSSDAGIEMPFPSGSQGTRTDQPLPNNAAIAVKWGTGLTGRSYRGRTFHYGMTIGHVGSTTSNFITEAYHDILQGIYDALLTAVNIADQQLVVASRLANSQPRTVGVATPIIACTIENTIDSQRRRLPGRGA